MQSLKRKPKTDMSLKTILKKYEFQFRNKEAFFKF